jgi:DNA-binding CsgD family transcriptional regulator
MTEQPRTRSAAIARADEAEDGMWRFLRDRIADGHSAAALTVLNLDQPWPLNVLYDDEVEVEVCFRQGDSEPSLGRLKFPDAVRLVKTGGSILDIGAPTPRSPSFLAIARVDSESFTHVALVRDLRGLGRMAMSPAPPPYDTSHPTFGDWYQQWAQHSGVPQLNERRTEAIKHLYQEYPNKIEDSPCGPIGVSGKEMAAWATIDAIAEHTERIPPGHEWLIIEQPRWWDHPAREWRSAGPQFSKKTIAESIVDAVSIEAYGATRRSLPSARGWEDRYVDEPDQPESETKEPKRYPGVVYGDTQDEAISRRPWSAEIMGQWTLTQGSPDPTGELASGLMDGRLTIAGALMAGIGSSGLIGEWRDAGLTDRQAQVLFATQMGFTDREIGNMLKRSPSTVRNALAKAREKISAHE